jgi:hypothetical protein
LWALVVGAWSLFGSIMFKRTGNIDWTKMQCFALTIIEIRPFRKGWQVCEWLVCSPHSSVREQAIDYATSCA